MYVIGEKLDGHLHKHRQLGEAKEDKFEIVD